MKILGLCLQMCACVPVHASLCACMRACVIACLHTCMCACAVTWCVCACMRACVHACVRACVRCVVLCCVALCVYCLLSVHRHVKDWRGQACWRVEGRSQRREQHDNPGFLGRPPKLSLLPQGWEVWVHLQREGDAGEAWHQYGVGHPAAATEDSSIVWETLDWHHSAKGSTWQDDLSGRSKPPWPEDPGLWGVY